jgi:RecT family
MNTTSQETTAVQIVETNDMPRGSINSAALVLNQASMESMMRVAELMASGKATVPKHLQNNPSDCLAVVMQAVQWQMNPWAVAQKTHLVNGTLGYEAQLVNAVVQSSNAIDGTFRYEFTGNTPAINCRAGAIIKGDKNVTWGEWLCENTVTTKNSPLWKVNPKQQMGYLQVKNWARLYCPGAILGVYTPDELDATPPRLMGNADLVVPETPPNMLIDAQAAASKGVAAYQKYWSDIGEEGRKSLKGDHERLKAQAIAADKNRTVPAAKTTAAASTTTAKPKKTFVSILDDMQKAENETALQVAAEWINIIEDEGERNELKAHFEELRAKLVQS